MRNLTKFCKVGLAPFFSNKLPFFKAEAPFWILCYFQLVRLAYVLGRVDTFAHNSLEFQMRKVLDFAKKKLFVSQSSCLRNELFEGVRYERFETLKRYETQFKGIQKSNSYETKHKSRNILFCVLFCFAKQL